MNILVTSSRMPFALDEIRKFGKRGHRVFATDTFATAPGSHSAYLAGAVTTAAPRQEPERFVRQLIELVVEAEIDLVVPAFEEVFYLRQLASGLEAITDVFAPGFEVLAQLHHKGRFVALAEELAIAVPRTVLVSTQEELASAGRELGAFFARPSYSRGGVELLTNRGPLADAVSVEQCHPSPANPWLVQDFVQGVDVCSFSVCQHGRVVAHSTYEHPRAMEHAGGIVFRSIVEPYTLEVARRIATATGYHGQLSLDFIRSGAGLVAIECNPRPTAGVYLLSPEELVNAVLAPRPGTFVAPAGIERKVTVALVRDMLLHWREIPRDLPYLLSGAEDVYVERGDLLPALYQFLSYSHVLDYRSFLGDAPHTRSDLLAAYFYDICWDGEPLVPEGPATAGAERTWRSSVTPSSTSTSR